MKKVKNYLLEMEARKEFGEKQYNIIKKEFKNRYYELCKDFVGNGSNKASRKLEELKRLKNDIWISGLFQFLGGAMVGASLYSRESYDLDHTIISSIAGILIGGIATLVKASQKKEFTCLKSKFIELVRNGNSNGFKMDSCDLTDEESDKIIDVICEDGVDELIDN